jgi:hypothetical protein
MPFRERLPLLATPSVMYGVGLSSVSNLSAHLPGNATTSRTSPRAVGTDELGRCGASMVLEGGVWGPHSLHTAEATGSKPVTPTSTNSLLHLALGGACQKICQKTTLSRHRSALSAARIEGLDESALTTCKARRGLNHPLTVHLEDQLLAALAADSDQPSDDWLAYRAR